MKGGGPKLIRLLCRQVLRRIYVSPYRYENNGCFRSMKMADNDPATNQPAGYVPPQVWQWDKQGGGRFANINRPVSGATHDKALPVGRHPLQLYSLGTPNGIKVTILLEELLAAGFSQAEYDAWLINIGEGDQFGSGFVSVNPNSKIPALLDYSTNPPTRLFESGSILFYLAEKFGVFFPTEPRKRAETMNWLMWQMGSAPFVGGGFGHFYAYAPFKIEYAINRYAMETKRQLHVLDTQLANTTYVAGDDYTIADMAIYPWYGGLLNGAYSASEFLAAEEYSHIRRWMTLLEAREGVRRGRLVNRADGLAERHEAADFNRLEGFAAV
ncbi:MAG: glutathione-dependent disulfide-bond oxidoreductase [Asticcacaulis sp.]|uniref:glutathione-dependent disulfide-bond oxidoreductase n=1 Tax=Asticcacaulis sp. TaxID=1872648 RepID=UPI0039E69640